MRLASIPSLTPSWSVSIAAISRTKYSLLCTFPSPFPAGTCDPALRGANDIRLEDLSRISNLVPDITDITGGFRCIRRDLLEKMGFEKIRSNGYAFAEEYDVERKFREARLYTVAPISTNLILSYLSEHVLGLPRSY